MRKIKKTKKVNVNRDVIKDFSNKLQFGIKGDDIRHVETLEELRSFPPGLITAKALKTFFINQNGYVKKLHKGSDYVMSMMTFKNLWVDKSTNTKLLSPGDVKISKAYRPYLGQDLTNKSILFIRHGGIGDLLFCNVLLQHIKEKYPTCKVSFATGISYQKMMKDWTGLIDNLLELPVTSQIFVMHDYQVIFEGVIERNEEAKKINAYDLFSKWVNLDIPDDKKIPRQTPNQDRLIDCDNLLKEWNLKEKEFIVLQPDASSPIRTPSDEFWVKLINKFTDKNYKIVVVNSKHKKKQMEKLISKCDKKENVFNFADEKHELDLLVALISKSMIVVGTDSASLHIAASLDIPLFGIYGPFIGEVRLTTYKNADWINAKKECAPCFIHSYNPCEYSNRQGNPSCFNNIDLDDVVHRTEKLLKI